jgi:thioredoxin-like negative regulator of GroEL
MFPKFPIFKPITTLFIFLLIFPNIFCGEDYYKLLGVKRSATKNEIRRAFKKLSLKYHPDKNKDNPEKAKAKFIKIANAYEVLNDDKLRKIYDEQGEEGVKQHQQGGGQHGGNFQDIFNFFFRGANMNFQNQEGPEKNFFENTDVLTLKMENISKLLSRRKIWFVYFFKSKDEGFENMNNKIKEISSQCYGIFNFGAVNCKDDEEICEEYSVYSTPKIVYFPESANEVEEEYKGNIDFQSIFKYGAKLMQNFVRVINKDNYNDFITTYPERYHVLLFTSKKTTPPLFKSLSKDYLNHLSFGEVRQTENELIKTFNVDKFPTLMVLTNYETNEVDVFKEDMKYDTIKKFLNKYGYKKMPENKEIKVRELNKNTYEKLGMCSSNDNKNICLIFFINKEKPENDELKNLENFATKFKDDHIKVFYLNVDKYKSIFKSFDNDEINFENTSGVIVKGKRKKYIAVSKESYQNIKDFYNIMDNVISGGGSFKQLKKGLILENNTDKTNDL